MKIQVDISVIVPVWQTEPDLLKRCIDSIINQTFDGSVEAIVAFDGKGQAGFKWCLEHYGNDNNVVLMEKENTGVSDTRNKAMDLARGKYMMFCDADDSLNESICEKAFASAEKNSADMVIWNYVCVHNDKFIYNRLYDENEWIKTGNEKISLYYGNICRAMDPDLQPQVRMGIGGVWNRMYRTDVLRNNNVYFPTDCAMSEDVLLNLYAVAASERIVYINCDGYYYYIFENSSSNKWDVDGIVKNNKFLNRLEEFKNNIIAVKHSEELERFRRAQQAVTVNTLIRQLNVTVYSRNNPEKFLEKRKNFKEIISKEPYFSAIKQSKFNDFAFKQKFSLIAFRLRSYFLVALLLKLSSKR